MIENLTCNTQCTQNSGTLSYKEIKQIIDQNKLTPYYDEVAAVKYIVWNQDQWVSYVSCYLHIIFLQCSDHDATFQDDEVTFKQKIDFANKLGLGGLLIWSVSFSKPVPAPPRTHSC